MPRTRTALDLGQLFIIGFDGIQLDSRLRALLTNVQPSGVILFKRNIVDAQQTWRLLRDCQRCVTTPLFLCVDMEGGAVDRFRDVFGASPAPAEVFATGDRRLFQKHGKLIGEACWALGFNVDFAPVLDLALAPAKPVMKTRVVSENPAKVVLYARAFLRGLQQNHVLGCAKHFPGLGEARFDTHEELPAVEKALAQMLRSDLQPYKLLSRELPFVMVGHAAYPAVTGDRMPASLSRKWVRDVLRKKLGYRGLVVTDDMEMEALQKAAPMDRAAELAIRAGIDQLLICHQEDAVVSGYEAVCHAADRDRAFLKRATESVGRVTAFKKKFFRARRPASAPRPSKMERISRAIWEFSEQARLESLAQEEGA